MDDKTAFHPEPASGVTLAVTDVSARVALGGFQGASRAVRVVNAGANPVFIEFGQATVAAALNTGMYLPAGQTEVFDIGLATYLAAIAGAGLTSTLYATSGVGL